MRITWPAPLLSVSLTLACSNELPPLNETGATSDPVTTDGATSLPGPTTTNDDEGSTTHNETSSTLPTNSDTDSETNPSGDSTEPIGTTDISTSTGTASTAETGETGETGETEGNSSGSTSEPLATCVDGQQNDTETDVDCGGPDCPACDDELKCDLSTDCASEVCTDSVCVAPSCDDDVLNQGESDVDCGGLACAACPDGAVCGANTDCESGVCISNACEPQSCDDNIKNQDETDVDCGGAVCDPCGAGEACVLNTDCDSAVCTDQTCADPTCFDGATNQDETDVDCGGAACAPCQLPGLILNEVDYDNVSTDGAEFVEVYNNTGADVDLASIHLVLINGTDSASYFDEALGPGTLAQGQYLVVAPVALAVPPGAIKVEFTKVTNNIQNDTEGVALVDTAAGTLLDALSFEGSITMANVPGIAGPVSLVEGAAFAGSDSNTVQRSISRFPNGNDKNNALTDWTLSTTPTPGLANVP